MHGLLCDKNEKHSWDSVGDAFKQPVGTTINDLKMLLEAFGGTLTLEFFPVAITGRRKGPES